MYNISLLKINLSFSLSTYFVNNPTVETNKMYFLPPINHTHGLGGFLPSGLGGFLPSGLGGFLPSGQRAQPSTETILLTVKN